MGTGGGILIRRTFSNRQQFLKEAIAAPVTVYLRGCQRARFLLCLPRLMPKCLWQVDESVSYGHLSLYPTCQSGNELSIPSKITFDLARWLHKAKRTQVKKQKVMQHYGLKRGKNLTAPSSWNCSVLRVISHVQFIWYGFKISNETVTPCDCTPWQAGTSNCSLNQNNLLSPANTFFSADVSNFKSRAPRPDLANLGLPVHKHDRQTDDVLSVMGSRQGVSPQCLSYQVHLDVIIPKTNVSLSSCGPLWPPLLASNKHGERRCKSLADESCSAVVTRPSRLEIHGAASKTAWWKTLRWWRGKTLWWERRLKLWLVFQQYETIAVCFGGGRVAASRSC